MDIEQRDRDPQASARPAVRLADIRTAWLFQPLQRAEGIRQADLGEGWVDVAPAAFKHAENVPRRCHLPGG